MKEWITTAEEDFDFLGFHFIRWQNKQRGKEVTFFFPSKKAKSSFMKKVSVITPRRHAHTKSETAGSVQRQLEIDYLEEILNSAQTA